MDRMSEEFRGISEDYVGSETPGRTEQPVAEKKFAAPRPVPPIPDYLQDTYWWAYLHPKAFWFFEREWVVNLILWGNMRRLTRAVLDQLRSVKDSRVLQVACVYGKFSSLLAGDLAQRNSQLDLLDVAPVQINNAREKLSGHDNIDFHLDDSSDMHFADKTFDESVVFFLLHEQPEDVRRKTISEAIRVTRPGGKVIFVDYHGPSKANPMRYVMWPILNWLEPFAMDLWRDELPSFLPEHIKKDQLESEFYFGGLYQKVILTV